MILINKLFIYVSTIFIEMEARDTRMLLNSFYHNSYICVFNLIYFMNERINYR